MNEIELYNQIIEAKNKHIDDLRWFIKNTVFLQKPEQSVLIRRKNPPTTEDWAWLEKKIAKAYENRH